MAVIKQFPKGGKRPTPRKRWQGSSGAPGPRPSNGARGRKPRLIELMLFIVLCVIAVAVALQSHAVSKRPPPQAMANYDFRTCKEARAAGAAPLMRGEPWYRSHLDDDGDGVACEFHPKSILGDLLG